MSAADQAEPMLQRLEALIARGRELEEHAKAAEDRIAELLPQFDTDLVTATVGENGVLTTLTFTDAATDATPEQLEDAVNIAVARAAGADGLVSDTIASAVVAALAEGGIPEPSEHIALDGAIRVQALMGRPGRIQLDHEYVRRTRLTAVADAIVAAHAAAARESAPAPPNQEA